MNPKEKAYELCNKFMICNSYQAIVWHNARICALIAVDEIINDNPNIYDSDRLNFKYWANVKKEIEKL